jgi:hypothetical protein
MRIVVFASLSLCLVASACSSRRGGLPATEDAGSAGGGDTGPVGLLDAGPMGFADTGAVPTCTDGRCYTLYAHSDHVLYSIDLMTNALTTVGPFNAPTVSGNEDVITDLAVSPDDVIYVVSHTALYTADATDGHVTRLGSLSSCGTATVALSFAPDGTLYAGDFHGAFCRIDTHASPPAVSLVAMLSDGYALAGDIVVVGDGTMFGTVYHSSDPANTGSQLDNILAEIDPSNGRVTPRGATGYPKLFGTAYQLGHVWGFTHDGSGDVITIDPTTGASTLVGTFTDPSTGNGISFAGAGVNAHVPHVI